MTRVLTLADMAAAQVQVLLGRYGLELEIVPDRSPIEGSFWGEPEAGIAGKRVYARSDTPLHSILHETAHVVCMTPGRRSVLHRDAGGDDLEEAAVCYLQVLLGGELPGAGMARLMRDMDVWGYSFRLGSTRNWFEKDALDARNWLMQKGLLDRGGSPVFELRKAGV